MARKITPIDTIIKIKVYRVGLLNKMLNTSAVPVLVMNVDAMISFPISVLDKFVSTRAE